MIDVGRPHVTFNHVWEMPFFKGSKGALPMTLGRWQLSGLITFQSGLPVNVTQPGEVANFGGGTGGQRPDIVGDPHEGRGASLARYFNFDAFRQATRALGIGTSPYNAVRGPGIANFDFSLFKNIAPREGMNLQLGAEVFQHL